MQKKNVLIIENATSVTGGFNAIRQSTLDLRNEFNFIYLINKGSIIGPNIQQAGFDYYKVSFVEISKRPRDLLMYLPMLLVNVLKTIRIVRKNKIDIIHSNDFYNLIGAVCKMLMPRLKLIVHIRMLARTFPATLYKFWIGVYAKRAEHIIAVSTAVQKELPKLEKVHVIHDHVASDHIQTKKDYTIDGKIKLLYVANYTFGKGQHYAIDVVHRLVQNGYDVVLNCYGGTASNKNNIKNKASLKEKIEGLNLQNHVFLNSSTDDFERLLSENDIFLNFSESESLSLTCIEACLVGTPVVATNCGGPADIIDHEVNGILVTNKKVDEMYSGVERLIKDNTLREKIGIAAAKEIREKFSSGNTSDKLRKVYQSIQYEQ